MNGEDLRRKNCAHENANPPLFDGGRAWYMGTELETQREVRTATVSLNL